MVGEGIVEFKLRHFHYVVDIVLSALFNDVFRGRFIIFVSYVR